MNDNELYALFQIGYTMPWAKLSPSDCQGVFTVVLLGLIFKEKALPPPAVIYQDASNRLCYEDHQGRKSCFHLVGREIRLIDDALNVSCLSRKLGVGNSTSKIDKKCALHKPLRKRAAAAQA